MNLIKRLIMIFTVLSMMIFAFYHLTSQSFNQLSVIEISIQSDSEQTWTQLSLNSDEKSIFLEELHSKKQIAQPSEEILKTYQLTVKNFWQHTVKYEVLYLNSGKIIINNLQDYHYYVVEEPHFFATYSFFDAIYHPLSPPMVQLKQNGAQSLLPSESINWQIRKWDRNWYDWEASSQTLAKPSTYKVSSNHDTIEWLADKSIQTASLIIRSKDTGNTVWENDITSAQLPIWNENGSFEYELSLNWNAETEGYKGAAVYRFDVEIAIPAGFTISKTTVYQGELIYLSAFYIDSVDSYEVVQDLNPFFKWYGDYPNYRAYLPTSYITDPGLRNIEITHPSTGESQHFTVEVLPRDFKVQRLVVDTSIEEDTQTDDAYAEYRQVFNPARRTSHDERYYTEPFILPIASGHLNTELGEKRTINGAPTSYRHQGIDIGAKQGTPVFASNAGKVVLAYHLVLTGNTVILDHGEGIFTVYEHMNSLTVTLGELVKRGQTIGTVGSTGFSTGPHLHFMISYYNINLEPGYFWYHEALTKETHYQLEP